MMTDKSVISNLPVERVLSERPLSECGGRVHPLLRAVSEPLLGWWSNRVTLPPILSDCQIRSHQVFPSIVSSQHHALHHTPHIPPYHLQYHSTTVSQLLYVLSIPSNSYLQPVCLLRWPGDIFIIQMIQVILHIIFTSCSCQLITITATPPNIPRASRDNPILFIDLPHIWILDTVAHYR